MDPALRQLLTSGADREPEEVEAIIRLDQPHVDVAGVRIVARFGHVATCRLRVDRIVPTWHDDNVLSLKQPRLVGPEPSWEHDADGGLPTGVVDGDERRPPDVSFTGAGVVIGVVDWGCDLDHPNFKNADGSTRLLGLWDQRGPVHDRSPRPYGYGTFHDRSQIDEALRSGDPYGALGYHPATADRDGLGAHGTHCMDIAAGNGRAGGPVGVAPGADLAFVHLAERGGRGLATLGDSARILEAVHFVARVAGRRPWVVNLSVGRCGGPHDGSTLAEQALDHLVQAAVGRFIVQSCGNYFDRRTHASGRLQPGSARSLTFVTDPADRTPNELEVWYPGGDELAAMIESPAGVRSPWVPLGRECDVVEDGVVGRLYHRRRDPNNGDNHIDLFLSPAAPAGAWNITLRAVRVVDGAFHAWLERDEACGPCQARFVPDDVDRRATTGTIANGRQPFVVGAYDGHAPARPVAPFSSAGPTRDGRPKPDCVAPGVQVLAARSAPLGHARSSGLLTRKSGTSMAAPHATGAVALCLEAARRPLRAAEIRGLLQRSLAPSPSSGRMSCRGGGGYLDIGGLVSAATKLAHRKELVMPPDPPAIVRPAALYRHIVYRRDEPLPASIDRSYVVVARPGEPPRMAPQRGDVIVRVALGERGPGHVAVLTSPELFDWHALDAAGVRGESEGPGAYATVLEEGSFPHCDGDMFARRVLDQYGSMPPGQVLLRPRRQLPEARAEEAETDLGRELVRRFPSGVRVAVFDPDTDELARRAAAWATREEAVGVSGTTVEASGLALGVAMSDSPGLVRTVSELHRALAEATGTSTGPALVRTLALFAHGWGTTLAIGLGLTAGNVDDVVSRLAPVLTDDVDVVLYGCSVCAQPTEGGWVATTMRPGGAESLCAKIRDVLVDQGKSAATVWGHTEAGHTTRNWSLRRFRAADGKGSPGEAYAGDIVFGPEKPKAVADVEAAITARGYRVVASRQAEFARVVLGRLERHLYRAYGQANRTKTHGGANLAERAPLHPDEVAEIIRSHWRDSYWVDTRARPFADGLVTGLRSLKVIERVPAAGEALAEQVLPQQCAFFPPAGGVVTEIDLRTAVRDVTRDERLRWLDAAGTSLLLEGDARQFGHLVRYWLATVSAMQPSTLTHVQAMAPTINYAPTPTTGLLNVTGATAINAAAAAIRVQLLAGAPGAGAPANLNTLVEDALKQALRSRTTLAWSSAFVSHCIRRVAINLGLEADTTGAHQGRDVLIRVSGGHRVYLHEAHQRRFATPREGTYQAFQPGARSVQIGDIIVQDRQPGPHANVGDVWQFANIPANPPHPGILPGRELHGDIVIHLANRDHAVAIGGNVGGSVRLRRYPLDANDRLVVVREQLYTQEPTTGQLPGVPRVNPAPGLNTQSTARIFALLSPVASCFVVPSPLFGGPATPTS